VGGALVTGNEASLKKAVLLSLVAQLAAEKNRVLAVESAAPSKHNDSNNLFIEDFEPISNVLIFGKDFRPSKLIKSDSRRRAGSLRLRSRKARRGEVRTQRK
jgi:hypothetical protein